MKIQEMIEIVTKKIKESKEHDASWRGVFRNINFSELQIHVGEELVYHLRNAQDKKSVFHALYSAISQLQTLYVDFSGNFREKKAELEAGKGTRFYLTLVDLVKKAEAEGVLLSDNKLVRMYSSFKVQDEWAFSLKYIISLLGRGEGHSGYGIIRDLKRTLVGCRRFTNQEEFRDNVCKAVGIAWNLLKDEKVLAESRSGEFHSESYLLNLISELYQKTLFVVMPSPAAVIVLSEEDRSRRDLLLPPATNLVEMINFLENKTNAARYRRPVPGIHGSRLDDFSGKMIIPGEEAVIQKLVIKLNQFRNAKDEKLACEGIRTVLLDAHNALNRLVVVDEIDSTSNTSQYYMIDKKFTVTNYFVKRQLETLHAIDVTSSPLLLSDIIEKMKDKIAKSQARDNGFFIGLFRDKVFSAKQIEVGGWLLKELQNCDGNNQAMMQLFKEALEQLAALTEQPNSASFFMRTRSSGEKVVGTNWYHFLTDLLQQIQLETVVIPEEEKPEEMSRIGYSENSLDAIAIEESSLDDAIGNERAFNSFGNSFL